MYIPVSICQISRLLAYCRDETESKIDCVEQTVFSFSFIIRIGEENVNSLCVLMRF
jgi:hypothetical protein